MKIACLQYDVVRGEREKNFSEVESLLGEVDADLIVLPEFFSSGYFFRSTDEAHETAESIPDGPSTQFLERLARETGATFVAGIPERAEDGEGEAFFNSAVVVTPRGWLGTYRKTHLYYEETLHFSPGDSGFPVWTVTDREGRPYRLGVMVCFDWIFPEAARSLALNGADILAHPANLVLPYCPDAMRTRAIENCVITATGSRIGSESNGKETLSFSGGSRICSARGDVLADAGSGTRTVITAEVDPFSIQEMRRLNRYNHLFEDRRSDLYALTADK